MQSRAGGEHRKPMKQEGDNNSETNFVRRQMTASSPRFHGNDARFWDWVVVVEGLGWGLGVEERSEVEWNSAHLLAMTRC